MLIRSFFPQVICRSCASSRRSCFFSREGVSSPARCIFRASEKMVFRYAKRCYYSSIVHRSIVVCMANTPATPDISLSLRNQLITGPTTRPEMYVRKKTWQKPDTWYLLLIARERHRDINTYIYMYEAHQGKVLKVDRRGHYCTASLPQAQAVNAKTRGHCGHMIRSFKPRPPPSRPPACLPACRICASLMMMEKKVY